MICGDSFTARFTEFIQHVDEYRTRLDLFPRPIAVLGISKEHQIDPSLAQTVR